MAVRALGKRAGVFNYAYMSKTVLDNRPAGSAPLQLLGLTPGANQPTAKKQAANERCFIAPLCKTTGKALLH